MRVVQLVRDVVLAFTAFPLLANSSAHNVPEFFADPNATYTCISSEHGDIPGCRFDVQFGILNVFDSVGNVINSFRVENTPIVDGCSTLANNEDSIKICKNNPKSFSSSSSSTSIPIEIKEKEQPLANYSEHSIDSDEGDVAGNIESESDSSSSGLSLSLNSRSGSRGQSFPVTLEVSRKNTKMPSNPTITQVFPSHSRYESESSASSQSKNSSSEKIAVSKKPTVSLSSSKSRSSDSDLIISPVPLPENKKASEPFSLYSSSSSDDYKKDPNYKPSGKHTLAFKSAKNKNRDTPVTAFNSTSSHHSSSSSASSIKKASKESSSLSSSKDNDYSLVSEAPEPVAQETYQPTGFLLKLNDERNVEEEEFITLFASELNLSNVLLKVPKHVHDQVLDVSNIKDIEFQSMVVKFTNNNIEAFTN